MKLKALAAIAALLGVLAMPALAKDPPKLSGCKTSGPKTSVAMLFPRNDGKDVDFARATLSAMMPDVASQAPAKSACFRASVLKPTGNYEIGGENGDPYPRIAAPEAGKTGPLIYLAPVKMTDGKTVYVLVARDMGGLNVVKRYFSEIPGDTEMMLSVSMALQSNGGIMAYDPAARTVLYAFIPDGGIPPALQGNERLANGNAIAPGSPQVMVSNAKGPPATLVDVTDVGMRHQKSRFICPYTFKGTQVLLNYVDPADDRMACNYRLGTDLSYAANAPVRYQMTVAKLPPGVTIQQVFADLSAQAKSSFKFTADRTPPLPAGVPPEPEAVFYGVTESGEAQGLWLGRNGDWLISIRSQLPATPEADREAATAVATVFGLASVLMKPFLPQPAAPAPAARQ